MNIVLLSGGSGQRLWPLSNDDPLETVYQDFSQGRTENAGVHGAAGVPADPYRGSGRMQITVATSKTSGVCACTTSWEKTSGVCVEPCRRDTFPAIALAASYLS